MIEVKDRISAYPGRVKMTPVDGEPDTYDMVRADEPLEPGTPINKALLDGIIGAVEAVRVQVDNTLFAISNRAPIGDIAVGTEIALMENGVLVPFIKIQAYYNGAAGNLVMRKNCVTKMPLMNAGDQKYESSRADLWLNNEYFQTLDVRTQAVAAEAPVMTRVSFGGSSGPSTIYRKVFLLATSEYNLTPSDGISYEGTEIAYFNSNQRRMATFDGVLTDHYTRSIGGGTVNADSVTSAGAANRIDDSTVTEAGIRPVLFFPDTYEVVVGMPNTANVVAAAEVI